MRAIVLFFLISGMLTACVSNDEVDKNKVDLDNKLKIVSTIKPIQAIVLAIVGDYAKSEQLIPDYASPHNYSFKPSDVRKMKKADVIFRIDEKMEIQLNAVFTNLEDNTVLVSLAESEGIDLLKSNMSESGKFKSSIKLNHDNVDFHIWTSSKNALIIANKVLKIITRLDPKNGMSYKQNFEIFKQSLKNSNTQISSMLSKHQNSQYIVFHNSWQYFADEFALSNPIVVDLHEGVSSGAKTVNEIRKKIEEENIKCVFYDTDVNEDRLRLLTENVKVNIQKIDVLANKIKPNQSAYINWYKQFGDQVGSCLSNS